MTREECLSDFAAFLLDKAEEIEERERQKALAKAAA